MNELEAAKILAGHNIWRRGGDGEQTDPKLLGECIDIAVSVLRAQAKSNVVQLYAQEASAGRENPSQGDGNG